MNTSGKKKSTKVANSANGRVRQQPQAAKGQSAQVSRSARRRIRSQEKKRLEMKMGGISTPWADWSGFSMKTGRGSGDTVGLAEYSTNVQTKMPRMKTSRGAVELWHGTEFLQQVSTGPTDPESGDILARILINPSVFDDTRIQQLAGLYQRYKFTRARIMYQADANATQSGSIIGFMDYDVDNLITTNTPQNVKDAAAHFAQQPTKIWQSRFFDLGQVDQFTSLFVNTEAGNEDRLTYQGVFYLFAATGLPSLTALGTLYLDYEIEFSIPSLENAKGRVNGYLGLQGEEIGTSGTPFGLSLAPLGSAGYPENNLDYTYNSSSGSVFSFDLDPGIYDVYFRASYSNSGTTVAAGALTLSGEILEGEASWGSAPIMVTKTPYTMASSPAPTGYKIQNINVTFRESLIVAQPSLVAVQFSLNTLASYNLSDVAILQIIRITSYAGVGKPVGPRDLGKRATFVLNDKGKQKVRNSIKMRKPLPSHRSETGDEKSIAPLCGGTSCSRE